VRFDHGYAQQLPYPDASFDRVLSSLMLHHIETGTGAQAEMFAEVRRVLAPGGQLVLADIEGSVGLHAVFGRLRRSTQDGRFGDLDALPAQLARAGFVETTELDPVTTRLGRVRLFRAQPR
jgi:SAM-dependent methyltransferase